MGKPKPALLSWSSGKDSALALYQTANGSQWKVEGLVTTYRETDGRIPIHEVPIDLVRRQAKHLGLPLIEVALPNQCPNLVYEERLAHTLDSWREKSILLFGDLHLADIRQFRENWAAAYGWRLGFPLWGSAPSELFDNAVRWGFRSLIVAVDTRQLSANFLGEELTSSLRERFTDTIDCCGENGEYHTFVYDGPIFKEPLVVAKGKTHTRDSHAWIDIQGG